MAHDCKQHEPTLRTHAGPDGINMDAIPQDDLMMIWHGIYCHPVRMARILFPDRPKGYVRATCDMGHYASNKATAMGCRLRGEINSALTYEGICESIYSRLPEYARW